jgi:serine phosphatase RsbU (regulator of sigma subunit)
VTFSSAGHNPPLVVRADGAVEQLHTRGIALGVIPNIKLSEDRITLNIGDLLVAYTDGVTEALRSDMAEFGVIGLQNTIVTLRQKPAQDIARGVLRAVDSFVVTEPQFDDVTMIVLKHLDHNTPERANQSHLITNT